MGFSGVPQGKRLGLDIGIDTVTAVVLDGGALAAAEAVSIEPGDSVIAAAVSSAKRLADASGQFASAGVAVPALVDRTGRNVQFSGHIAELSGFDLASAIGEAAGCAALVENDANAAGYAEFLMGAGRGCGEMFYATLGTGVGGCIILDGEIRRGVGGFAGEFGYVPVDLEGTRLEDVASSRNIIRRTRERFHRDATSSLVDIREEELTIADIVEAARKGDDLARLMLERTGNYVGIGVAAVINLLDIERIVVGGEILEAGEPILHGITDRARQLAFGPAFEGTAIVQGELGKNAAAIGSALLSASLGGPGE